MLLCISMHQGARRNMHSYDGRGERARVRGRICMWQMKSELAYWEGVKVNNHTALCTCQIRKFIWSQFGDWVALITYPMMGGPSITI